MANIEPYIYKSRLPFQSGGGVNIHSRRGEPPFMLGDVFQRIRERQRRADLEKRGMARQKIKDLVEMGKLDPSVLQSPEFETARKRAGYPAMTMPKQSSLEEAVSQVIGGYEKPTISLGSQGKVRGMTFRPKAGYPQEYKRDLASALSAIDRGADRIKVYQRIAAQYPKQSAELKRILLYTSAESRLEAFKRGLGLSME